MKVKQALPSGQTNCDTLGDGFPFLFLCIKRTSYGSLSADLVSDDGGKGTAEGSSVVVVVGKSSCLQSTDIAL